MHPPRYAEHERHHHEADNVVDKERREKSAGENDCGQKLVGIKLPQHCLRIPLKEADQVQVSDNQHHCEQQIDRLEVDVTQCVHRPHHAEAAIPTAPMIAAPVRSIFNPGNFPRANTNVTGEEDDLTG